MKFNPDIYKPSAKEVEMPQDFRKKRKSRYIKRWSRDRNGTWHSINIKVLEAGEVPDSPPPLPGRVEQAIFTHIKENKK